MRCLMVRCALYTNIVIHTYQSYYTQAHGSAVRLLHIAIESHTVSHLGIEQYGTEKHGTLGEKS